MGLPSSLAENSTMKKYSCHWLQSTVAFITKFLKSSASSAFLAHRAPKAENFGAACPLEMGMDAKLNSSAKKWCDLFDAQR
jgi:hypothetical protein